MAVALLVAPVALALHATPETLAAQTIPDSTARGATPSAAALGAPTPEQRYGDWVRRMPFRPQEYAFRRSNMIRLLRESGGGIFVSPSTDGTTDGDTFRQLEDFWYYTGLEVPNSVLVLDAERDHLRGRSGPAPDAEL